MISPASETTPADVILIGDCTVTLSLREVVVPGARRPRRLTPKALGVLKALMRVPGAVVSRDELFAEVWPDTLPTNDVLTQAVTQLRKAFSGDDEGGAVYIETIAKTGYRLVQPVSDVPPVATDASDVPGGDAAPASAWVPRPRSLWRRTRRYVYLALGLAMFIAMMVMAALLSQRSAPTAYGGVLEVGSRVVGSPPRP